MPTYVIEPPDILTIDAIRIVPKPPYKIEPLDTIGVYLAGLPKDFPPISGSVTVDADGTINLAQFSSDYGGVLVTGMTLKEAQGAIEVHMKKLGIKEPVATVIMVQSRGLQQIRGEHLVRPDGTVFLGIYGSVYLAGLSMPDAKAAIEKHLSQFFLNPNVSLDVLAYNSKVYYVIADLGGLSQTITRLPITGNETVLDALAQANGLPREADKHRIWVARPAPANSGGPKQQDQILPVDYNGITQRGAVETNYQLFPGDRLYVKADPWVTLDNVISKLTTPAERVFGTALLGRLTILEFQQRPAQLGGGGTSGGTGLGR
jgi:polysaccharide export outer membrane protein